MVKWLSSSLGASNHNGEQGSIQTENVLPDDVLHNDVLSDDALSNDVLLNEVNESLEVEENTNMNNEVDESLPGYFNHPEDKRYIEEI